MFTYGFYNSVNGDRKYDAMQMSAIFDGIINDGIFMGIGSALMVTVISGMTVKVGTGRAWFNHTWSWNNSDYPLSIAMADPLNNRIDTVILEVNSNDNVRENSLKILKGTPSGNPQAPTLVRTSTINQYALANILVRATATSITQADITNRVGIGSTPFVTGILETLDVGPMLAEWTTQWLIFKKILEDVIYNFTGPQGPKGDTGATGPKGDKGDIGEHGASASRWTEFVYSQADFDIMRTI